MEHLNKQKYYVKHQIIRLNTTSIKISQNIFVPVYLLRGGHTLYLLFILYVLPFILINKCYIIRKHGQYK